MKEKESKQLSKSVGGKVNIYSCLTKICFQVYRPKVALSPIRFILKHCGLTLTSGVVISSPTDFN